MHSQILQRKLSGSFDIRNEATSTLLSFIPIRYASILKVWRNLLHITHTATITINYTKVVKIIENLKGKVFFKGYSPPE